MYNAGDLLIVNINGTDMTVVYHGRAMGNEGIEQHLVKTQSGGEYWVWKRDIRGPA